MGSDKLAQIDVQDWRDRYAHLVAGARRLFVPDEDVALRVQRYLGTNVACVVRPHALPSSTGAAPKLRPKGADLVRKVLVISSSGTHKGSHVVSALAADSFSRGLPLHFICRGSINRPGLALLPTVTLAGPYRDGDIDRILGTDPPDMLLIPSVAPETYSYTLSIAFRNRIFPVCFDIGAPARRIRSAGFGRVVPYDLIFDPRGMNDLLSTIEIETPSVDLHGEDSRAWPGAAGYYGFA